MQSNISELKAFIFLFFLPEQRTIVENISKNGHYFFLELQVDLRKLRNKMIRFVTVQHW